MGLQPSKVNVISQGGMASAFAKASPFAKGFGGQVGGHLRAVPIFHFQNKRNRSNPRLRHAPAIFFAARDSAMVGRGGSDLRADRRHWSP